MKTLSPAVLLVLAVVPGCSREDVHTAAKPAAAAAAARPGLATVAAKAEPVPAGKRRVLELEGGVRVEVIAEGEGEIVGPGDEVALSMTLTYVPKSPEELKADAAKAEEAAKAAEKKDAEKNEAGKKDTDKKDGPKKSKPKPAKDEAEPAKTEAKPADAAAVDAAGTAKSADEGAKTLPPLISESAVSPAHGAKSETAPTSEPAAKPDSSAEVETKAQAEPTAPGEAPAADAAPAAADSKPAADAATPPAADATAPAEGTAPAPAPLAAALEPVVVVSTKVSGTPIRARVGASGALLPGLSRALVGLRQGTVAEITLPAEAAYGAAGLPSAGIPPGTPLHATIEIREVKR